MTKTSKLNGGGGGKIRPMESRNGDGSIVSSPCGLAVHLKSVSQAGF